MNTRIATIAFALLMILTTSSLRANSAAELKARMKGRLPAVNALKEKGLVGENNKGYLEARGQLSDADKKVVSEENADRKTVYAILAKKLGQPISVIGSRRAVKIAERSKSGLWIQTPEGKWIKK